MISSGVHWRPPVRVLNVNVLRKAVKIKQTKFSQSSLRVKK